MFKRAKIGLIATIVFSLTAVLLPGRLEARGPGKGLFGQGRPAEETSSGSTDSGYRSEVADLMRSRECSANPILNRNPASPDAEKERPSKF
jgi:hypothetical protein